MARAFFFKTLFFFFYRILFRKIKSLKRNPSNIHATTTIRSGSNDDKFHRFDSLSRRPDIAESTLVFNVERALLKSSNLFPYFMLVAFEAGGLFRSIVLLMAYPFLTLFFGEKAKLRAMVAICFFGMKKEGFRAGSAVLPKFLLEDVGSEIFEVVRRGSKRVAVTNLPLVMVEGFLRDYLQIEVVVGREMKVFRGYYLGIMEDYNISSSSSAIADVVSSSAAPTIGITDFRSLGDNQLLLSLCKDVYLVSRSEKATWQSLKAEKYPKPLIFHDGRLAIKPTAMVAFQLLMWGPTAVVLSVLRIIISLTIPYTLSIPILAFSGLRLTTNGTENDYHSHQQTRSSLISSLISGSVPGNRDNALDGKKKGLLYVCNHRTLLDPLYICFALKTRMTALTYSLSRMSELLAPIKTVRLSRDRERDSAKMEDLLSRGDVVVCPEGTTCRENYLLRFSPLFSEIAEEVVPVALNTSVEMFHGTTAGGLKCLDPVFFLMNPSASYTLQILDKMSTCQGSEGSRYDVANRVQKELAEALGFECTLLTRRDKYLVLAGNEGIVKTKTTTTT